MFREIREWSVNKVSTKQVEYSFMDFYGPTVLLLETTPEEGYKILEVVPATYRCENSSVDIGINCLMKKMAVEFFEKNNVPFYVKSKFGRIFISSPNVDEAFDEFLKQLIIF